MWRSLQSRLTLTIIGLTAVPLLVVSILITVRGVDSLTTAALDAQQGTARYVAAEIRALIDERVSELRLLVALGEIAALRLDDQRGLLAELLAQQDAYQQLAWLNGSGQELIRFTRNQVVSDGALTSRFDDPAFNALRVTHSVYYGPIAFDPESREPLLTIAVPVIDARTGVLTHALLAQVRFRPVWALIADMPVHPGETVYVLNRAGTVVAHALPSVVLRRTVVSLPGARGELLLGDFDDAVLFATYPIALGDQRLTVVAQQTTTEALGLAREIQTIALTVFIGVLLAAAGLTGLTIRQILRPVHALAAAAQAVRAGDLTQRVPVTAQNELGALAAAFNEMTAQMDDLVRTLEDRVSLRTRDLQVAMSVSRQTTTVLDLDVLLPKLVEVTRRDFDLYFVAVFLLDGERLVQRAGSDDNVTLPAFSLNDTLGLVAQAARRRQAVLANDVRQAADYFFSPLLPRTASELALPLLVGDTLTGVLDLHAAQVRHFSGEDVRVFNLLAEQVAIAVQNASLYARQQRVMEDLRTVDRMKSRFIASMSHELRTPLNAILNFAQFVSTGMLGEVNEQQKEALQRIVSSGSHLLSLINDILDIAKIEAGMMQLFVEDNVKLDEELTMVVATSEGLFREGAVRFVTRIEPELPPIVGDRRRIRQILLNLIANAAKFTDQGEVELRVRRDGEYVLFSVRDTGKGIPADKREDIFVPFHQTEHGLRHDSGTGLGLPISRSLAEAHQGTLWVESEEGRGSIFFVKLPIRSAALLAQL